MKQLVQRIDHFVAAHNTNCQPFKWTATADSILEELHRLARRKAMIERTHRPPITRQAQIVNISRGSVYYEAQPVSDADLKLMRRIDELNMELPSSN